MIKPSSKDPVDGKRLPEEASSHHREAATTTKIFSSSSVEETMHIGELLAKAIPNPAIVAFFGDLGAGKTTLIRAYAKTRTGLLEEEISSPTFQILHVYEGKLHTLFHFDLWRIHNEDEFQASGFDEYLDSKYDLSIEWSEKIESLLPKNAVRIFITQQSPTERLIEVAYRPSNISETLLRLDTIGKSHL